MAVIRWSPPLISPPGRSDPQIARIDHHHLPPPWRLSPATNLFRPGCESPGTGLFCQKDPTQAATNSSAPARMRVTRRRSVPARMRLPGTGLFRPGCGCRAPVCSARRILHTQLQLSPPGTHHSFSVLSESSRQFIKSIMRYPCPDPDGRHPAGLICCKHSLTTTAPHSSTAISCIVGLVCSARENKY